MTLYGRNGKSYFLESSPFATGGEGKIFNLVGEPDTVAKVYKSPDGREKKILVMIDESPSKEQLRQIAWPLDVLYDYAKNFVGFTMYKLNINEDLNVIYEYGTGAKYSQLPWRNKIIIGRNLCAVVGSMHDAGHIIGDFNPKNISVNATTGRITMLDADSCHIKDGTYRCTVAMPDYVLRGIQKKMKKHGLESAPLPTFTKESDNFALAIHIFQLLMNGVHPFASAVAPGYESESASLPSDNIMRGECAFFRYVRHRIPPRFAPSIKILPKKMRLMFRRAFLTKKPPTADQWFAQLVNLEKNLVNCRRIPYHQYRKAKKCPWCAADANFTSTIKTVKKKEAKVKETKVKEEQNKRRSEQKREYKKRLNAERRRLGIPRISKEVKDVLLVALLLIGVAIAVVVAPTLLGMLT